MYFPASLWDIYFLERLFLILILFFYSIWNVSKWLDLMQQSHSERLELYAEGEQFIHNSETMRWYLGRDREASGYYADLEIAYLGGQLLILLCNIR